MARIQDLIAAIVATGEGFSDAVRIVTAAGHSSPLLRSGSSSAQMGWLQQSGNPALQSMVAQGVNYKIISLKAGMSADALNSQSTIINHIQKLLHELQVRDEFHYPYAVIENHAVLLISTMDFDIIMAIARQLQQQEDDIGKPLRPRKPPQIIIPPE